MEDIIIHMENFGIHLGHLPRRYPHPNPVKTIGHIARKVDWVHNTFSSFNYSFILRGEGQYVRAGQVWEVRAPCVITQWPQVFVEYGPPVMWEELYLIFDPACLPRFKAMNLADPDKPVWLMHDPGPVRALISELHELIQNPGAFGQADRIDRVCEAMIMASFISEARPPLTEPEATIRAIAEHLRENLRENFDFDELALEFGLSPASFRRHWGRFIGQPPARYLMQLRLREARRLLVETTRPIGEIALDLNFSDPLYFSKKFSRIVGMTASDYRARHREPLSLSGLD